MFCDGWQDEKEGEEEGAKDRGESWIGRLYEEMQMLLMNGSALLNEFMDHTDRTKGYFLIGFSVWFLVGLFALITTLTSPDSMAYLGQFGDFFGFFNSLIALGTAYAAYRALQSQLITSNDQKQQFLEQQTAQQKFILAEKLEQLLAKLKLFHENSRGFMDKGFNKIDISYLALSMLENHEIASTIRTIINLYFPRYRIAFEAMHQTGLKVATILQTQHDLEDMDKKLDIYESAVKELLNLSGQYKELSDCLTMNSAQVINESLRAAQSAAR